LSGIEKDADKRKLFPFLCLTVQNVAADTGRGYGQRQCGCACLSARCERVVTWSTTSLLALLLRLWLLLSVAVTAPPRSRRSSASTGPTPRAKPLHGGGTAGRPANGVTVKHEMFR